MAGMYYYTYYNKTPKFTFEKNYDYAVKLVQEEVRKYKEQLNKTNTQYRILSEEVQNDGSIMIEIKKQYNTSPVGNYLND